MAFSFQRLLISRGEILFSVVSEPPPSRPEDACVDLCTAPWCPTDAVNDGLITLDLRTEDGNVIGSLEFEWKGAKLVHKLLAEQA